jgi:methylenetetrahydrofolate reductase (NADPH)
MLTRVPYSFELFPPRTPQGEKRLPDLVSELSAANPEYFSVTFGAGGTAQEGTYETVLQVAKHAGAEAAPHLTCVGSSEEQIKRLLERYKNAGVKRVVALRGDLPATAGRSAPGAFRYANELVQFIRDTHGDDFKIEVAAYPEMHPQATDFDTDFLNFKRKVDAGADAAITQYFFNADAYDAFLNRCARAGILVPIIPGIMPIVNYGQLIRFSDACGAEVPRWLRLSLERLSEDKEGLQSFGRDVVAGLCERLIDAGAPALHFYTLNQSTPTLKLLEALR